MPPQEQGRQPRQVVGEHAVAELAHSVREVGLLQPVAVRSTGDGAEEPVMGERRWRAMATSRTRVVRRTVRVQ